jgi:FeS assembly protein SufD
MPSALARGLSREAVIELSHHKSEPAWMLERRLQAWETYQALPAPVGHRADLGILRTLANFHFEDIAPFVAHTGASLNGVVRPLLDLDATSGCLTYHNSHVVATRLDPELARRGVLFMDLDQAVRAYPDLVQHYFMTECVTPSAGKYAAMHGAFWSSGVFLYVPRGVTIETPIVAQFLLDAASSGSFPHTLIVVESGATLRYMEQLNSNLPTGSAALFNSVIEVILKEGAVAEFNSAQMFGPEVTSVSLKRSRPYQDARMLWVQIDLGSRLTFADLGSFLKSNGSQTNFVGVFYADQQQMYQLHTLSSHQALSTTSDVFFKGVLNDRARVAFNGMIRIWPQGQKTNAYLQDHTLHLSDECRSESVPGLEIEANDVHASHGATSGQIDAEQLFYLMARGIPEEEARRMIVQGFYEPVLEQIPLEQLRAAVRRAIIHRMALGIGLTAEEEQAWHETTDRWQIEGVDEMAVTISD